MASGSASSPGAAVWPVPGRHNKLYRCPPTPTQDEQLRKEKSFVLDNNAVSSISADYNNANPKLGPAIPPYNGQRDSHTRRYFQFYGVDRTLTFYKQDTGGTSIDGPVVDRFQEIGAGYQYLSLRNQHGAGHSRQDVDGHAQFMQGIKPIVGYNGLFGYRRNTPWLRMAPSTFGVVSRSATH